MKHNSILGILAGALLFISGCTIQHAAVPVRTDPRSSLGSSTQPVSSKEGKNSSQISSKPESSPEKAIDQKELILVNAANKIPDDYKLDLNTAFDIQMDKITSEAYTDMWRSASEEGVTLWISSGYRSEEKQRSLFSDEVEKYIKEGLTRQQAEKKQKNL